jgi:hypothetical protein
MVSMITVPPMSAPTCAPVIVMTASSAFRMTWRTVTAQAPSPLARAVLT